MYIIGIQTLKVDWRYSHHDDPKRTLFGMKTLDHFNILNDMIKSWENELR